MSQSSTLQRGLNTRHIRFLALGSAIGTGLFYGSATAIKMAGPSVDRIAVVLKFCNFSLISF